MRVDRAAWPFVGGSLAVAIVFAWLARYGWAAPCFALAVSFVYFFRDPERVAPDDPHAVLAPADGRVLVAGPAEPGVAPPGTWQQVSIFLSPLDVHVNRLPVGGRVTRVEYRAGRFLPAYRAGAAAANERNEVWIDHDGETIVARQVVGILARRVVCRVGEGAMVRAGQRFGVMKFGSRMDVFLPPTATVRVRVGDGVIAGETVIAVLAAGPHR